MFTINKDITNQFGINIRNHVLVVKNIRMFETKTTSILSDISTVTIQQNISVTYSVESFIDAEAATTGVQGMPVVYNPSDMPMPSGYSFLLAEVPEDLILACQNHFVSLISNSEDTVAVPYSVTRRQARQQLMLMGMLETVEAAIAGIEDAQQKSLVEIYWNDSTAFERNNVYINMLANSIGLTQEQLDAAFIAAKKL